MQTDEFSWPSRVTKYNDASEQEWAAEVSVSHTSHNYREQTISFELDTGGSLRLTLDNEDARLVGQRLLDGANKDWNEVDRRGEALMQHLADQHGVTLEEMRENWPKYTGDND